MQAFWRKLPSLKTDPVHSQDYNPVSEGSCCQGLAAPDNHALGTLVIFLVPECSFIINEFISSFENLLIRSHLLMPARERKRPREFPHFLSQYHTLFYLLASHSPCPHTVSRVTASTLVLIHGDTR